MIAIKLIKGKDKGKINYYPLTKANELIEQGIGEECGTNKFGGEMEESIETCMALIKRDLSYIKEKVEKIEREVEGNYVTKTEFQPIKQIVYGMVGIVLVAVIGGLLTLILK